MIDDLIFKDMSNQVPHIRDGLADRVQVLKNIIRMAVKNKNLDGSTITASTAQTFRTRARKELQIVRLVDGLLMNIQESQVGGKSARLLLSPQASEGLERLLYPKVGRKQR